VLRLDTCLAQDGVPHPLGLAAEARATSSSRPKACTISIPTTASSAASVRSPFFSCTRREIGITLWANSQASPPIAGIDTAV